MHYYNITHNILRRVVRYITYASISISCKRNLGKHMWITLHLMTYSFMLSNFLPCWASYKYFPFYMISLHLCYLDTLLLSLSYKQKAWWRMLSVFVIFNSQIETTELIPIIVSTLHWGSRLASHFRKVGYKLDTIPNKKISQDNSGINRTARQSLLNCSKFSCIVIMLF